MTTFLLSKCNEMGVSVDNTHGALLLGLCASLGLLGVCTVQLFYYFSHYNGDPKYLKLMVGSLWLTEAINCALASHGVYRANIDSFNPETSDFCRDVPVTLKIVMLFNGFTYATVQGFFAYRLKVISRRIWLTRMCWFISAFRFISDLLLLSFALARPIVTFTAQYRYLLYIAMLMGSFTDCLIAGSLSYWFVKQKQDEVPNSNRILKHLLAYSMESGAVTSLFGLCVLITGVTMSHNFVWIALIIVHSKFHSNSLFVSLNRRRILRERRDAVHAKHRSPLSPLKSIQFAKVFSFTSSSSGSSSSRKSQDHDIGAGDRDVEVHHEHSVDFIPLQPMENAARHASLQRKHSGPVLVISTE